MKGTNNIKVLKVEKDFTNINEVMYSILHEDECVYNIQIGYTSMEFTDKVQALEYLNNLFAIHSDISHSILSKLTNLIESISISTDILCKSSLKSVETLEKIDYHLKNWCVEEIPDNIDRGCIIIKKTLSC